MPKASIVSNSEKITGYFVQAHYDRVMDERRHKRIEDAITRCDAWGYEGGELEDGFRWSYSNVDWQCEGDDPEKPENTTIEIYVRSSSMAERLASELRGCGMAVAVSRESRYDAE